MTDKSRNNSLHVLIIDPQAEGTTLSKDIPDQKIYTAFFKTAQETASFLKDYGGDAVFIHAPACTENNINQLRTVSPEIIIGAYFKSEDEFSTDILDLGVEDIFPEYVIHGPELAAKVELLTKRREIKRQQNQAADQRLAEVTRQKELLDMIIDSIPVGIWLTDESGTIIKSNLVGEHIWTGAQYIPVTKLSEYKAWWAQSGELLKNEDWAVYKALKKGESFLNEILKIECSDGTLKTIINSAVPMKDRSGKTLGVIVANQDITDLKKIEEQLTSTIEEKEVLIKEIHHRVKNNLQIISSIFNLQINYANQKSIEEILQESQDRVRTMALVYEQLYKSKSLNRIHFSSYLKDILNHLFNIYRDAEKIIRQESEVEEVYVNIDTAIELGLVVNELIVNALKHAFTGKHSGLLQVSLKKHDSKGYILTIKDDGCGLPENFNLQDSGTLGMLLVDSMISQLNAEINISSKNGTYIEIIFNS